MRLFGLEITRTRSLPTTTLYPPAPTWWSLIREPFTGAWQQNATPITDTRDTLLRTSAVYACVTGIASDVAKMRIKLDRNEDGIWTEITANSPFLPVLRKPNHYQNRIKFIEQWIVSKLLHGNAYILKQRDNRGIVTALYVLDPMRVCPLVAEDGSVYYDLKQDYLSEVPEPTVIPASEIIHDMMVSLWHPLIGVPPLYACAMSATMGNRIQANSTSFFANASRPGGILTAPQHIPNDVAERLKAAFEEKFGGNNAGRLAVLGDGLKFEPMVIPAETMQLIEQLKFTVEDVARAFHYPLFKLGGPLPPYAGNTESLIISYYTDCLQTLIESIELTLDEGLDLPPGMGTELDLDNLLRMDTAALFDSNNKAVGGGWMSPDEARYRANFAKVPGGDTPYLQQQYWSLEQLSERGAPPDPGVIPSSPSAPPPELQPTTETDRALTDIELSDLEDFATNEFEQECLIQLGPL